MIRYVLCLGVIALLASAALAVSDAATIHTSATAPARADGDSSILGWSVSAGVAHLDGRVAPSLAGDLVYWRSSPDAHTAYGLGALHIFTEDQFFFNVHDTPPPPWTWTRDLGRHDRGASGLYGLAVTRLDAHANLRLYAGFAVHSTARILEDSFYRQYEVDSSVRMHGMVGAGLLLDRVVINYDTLRGWTLGIGKSF